MAAPDGYSPAPVSYGSSLTNQSLLHSVQMQVGLTLEVESITSATNPATTQSDTAVIDASYCHIPRVYKHSKWRQTRLLNPSLSDQLTWTDNRAP